MVGKVQNISTQFLAPLRHLFHNGLIDDKATDTADSRARKDANSASKSIFTYLSLDSAAFIIGLDICLYASICEAHELAK